MTKIDRSPVTLARETLQLLEQIGGANNLKIELSHYDAASLRQQFGTIEALMIRLFDSWWNTTRRQLLIRHRFRALHEAVLEVGVHRLSSMSRDDFEGWLVSVFHGQATELTPKRNWKQFVDKGGAWDCLQFIAQFPNTTEFYNSIATKIGVDFWANITANWDTYATSPWQVAEEIAYRYQPVPQSDRKGIYGMGTVLVCDFLKEIGVDCYGKPDTQVRGVFGKIGLIGKHHQERDTFRLFWHIASATGYPPVAVDKILWMAASGRWDKTLDLNLVRTT